MRWAWSSAGARQAKLAGISLGANTEKGLSEVPAGMVSAGSVDAKARYAVLQMVHVAVLCTVGDQATDLLEAVADGKPLPQPDVDLRNEAGLPVLCARIAGRARFATDADSAAMLAELGQMQRPGLLAPEEAGSQYQRFLEQTTLSVFVHELSDAGEMLDARQIILALGLLLQPVMNSVGQPIDKGLCLPLPRNDANCWLVATFWMDLVSRFLARSTYDLTLFLPKGETRSPCLLIGFSAGAASALHGLLDPRATDSVFLRLHESPWVEAYVDNDYALKKLSSYLQLPQMSLAQVLATFQEAFLGN